MSVFDSGLRQKLHHAHNGGDFQFPGGPCLIEAAVQGREFGLCMRMQWTNKDHLWIIVLPASLGAFAESTTVTRKAPSCRLTACALEPAGINECLNKPYRMTIDSPPIH